MPRLILYTDYRKFRRLHHYLDGKPPENPPPSRARFVKVPRDDLDKLLQDHSRMAARLGDDVEMKE